MQSTEAVLRSQQLTRDCFRRVSSCTGLPVYRSPQASREGSTDATPESGAHFSTPSCVVGTTAKPNPLVHPTISTWAP